jgi:hypothetical protein
MNCTFAIIPDGSSEPAAVFADLEDAMDWGLQRFGGDSFRIRHVVLQPSVQVVPRFRLGAA